jgi:hypothetical protein
MSKHLDFVKSDTPLTENVIFRPNGKKIGEIFREVDGEYYFQPESHGGAWQGYVLMELGVHLSLLNTPMNF